MKDFYWMNKEHGYLVSYDEIWQDAIDCGYDDVTDPTSIDYLDWSVRYTLTRYTVERG